MFVFRKKILHECQAGFRKGYSTYDIIFVLDAIIEHVFKTPGRKLYAMFIDFSAAFDTVNRESLLYKLGDMGVSSQCINVIRLIYRHTSAKVWTKKGFTEKFDTNCGVRQGCLLSPLLFTLYINDLADEIDSGGFCFNGTYIRMLMYADDIVFLAADPDALQGMINSLSTYCEKWDLHVNLNKSKIMIFRKKGIIKHSLRWLFRGKEVEIVNSYKYLGVLFVSNGRFGQHLDGQLAVAKFAINQVYRKIFFFKACNIDSFFRIFNAVARSIMCYAAQVWGFHQYDVVERVFRFFLKKVLKLPGTTPNYVLFLETGQDPIFVYALKLHWTFVLQTFRLPENRFRRILMEVGIVGEHKWFQMLRDTAMSLGQWDQFSNFTHTGLKDPINNLYQGVLERERQGLLDLAMLGTHHPSYKNVKLEWGREAYFNDKLSLRAVGYIMMARSDMLPLSQKLWFAQADYTCNNCNMQAAEDGEHFICICPIWREFRSLKFKSFSYFNILKGEAGWNELSTFICRALNYRKLLNDEFG